MLPNSEVLDPFALWDVARSQLDDAIQLYLDTSAALAVAVSQSPNPFPDQKSFEAAVNIIRCDIQCLNFKHEGLENARTSLSKIQNRSSTHIPFNRLPLEIITRIFRAAAGRGCACDRISKTLWPVSPHDYGPKTLLSLTHVCSYWRDIAIHTSSLWSHVTFDLSRNDDFADDFIQEANCPQTWLRRARSVPLYIHLDGKWPLPGSRQIPRLVANCLLPYLDRVAGFRIEPGWTYSTTRQLLFYLLAKGGADSVQEFIHLGGSGPFGDQTWLLGPQLDQSPPLESPLPSLRVIDMNDMCFSWESAIYRNLVALRLTNIDDIAHSPTTQQLLGALSACPELRILDLRGLYLEQQDVQFAPVTLGALELLDISFMSTGAISTLLPFLSSGESELSLRVDCTFQFDRRATNALLSFLRRSRITRLFVPLPISLGLSEYLAVLHDLRVLIIDFGSDQGDKNLEAITYLAHPDAGRLSPRCPNLQSLYLVNGALRNSTVQAAVEAHSLKRLTFGACFLDPFEEVLVDWLKPMVADVVCVKELNEDLTMNWNLYMI